MPHSDFGHQDQKRNMGPCVLDNTSQELRKLSFTRNHQLGLNACQDFLVYLSDVLMLCLHLYLSLLPLLTFLFHLVDKQSVL